MTFGDQLFVADSGNNRVLIWNSIPTENGAPADVVLGQVPADDSEDVFTLDDNNSEPTAQTLSEPAGLLVVDNKLIVVDANSNRVLIYQGQ